MKTILIPCRFDLVSSIEPSYLTGSTAISNTGIIATAAGSNIILLDSRNWKKLGTLLGDDELFTALSIDHSGNTVLAASKSLQLFFFSVLTRKKIRTVKAHISPVICVSINKNDALAATGAADGTIRIWDINGGFIKFNLTGHNGLVSALAFGSGCSEDYLASGDEDGTLRIWNTSNGVCITRARDHASVIRGITFDELGSQLFSGARDKMLNVYNINNAEKSKGKQTIKLKRSMLVNESIESIILIPNNSTMRDEFLIITGGEENIPRVWDLEGNLIFEHRGAQESQRRTKNPVIIIDLKCCKVSKTIFSFHSNSEVRQYRFGNDALNLERLRLGQMDEVIDARFLNSSLWAVAINSNDVHLMSQQDGSVASLRGHKDIVLCLDTDISKRFIATGSKDMDVRLWEVTENKRRVEVKSIAVMSGHASVVSAVILPRKPRDPVSSYPLFVLSVSEDLTVKKWLRMEENENPPKYKSIFTRKIHEKEINAMDLAPDDSKFATASQDKTVKIFDIESVELLGTLKGHRKGVWGVSFCRLNRSIATSSGDKTIKVWSLKDFSCIRTFEGHTHTVLKIIWITQGLQLASSGADGLIRIWNIKEGKCDSVLDGHTDRIWALDTWSDGNQLISGGADGLLNFWQDVTAVRKAEKAKELEEVVHKEQKLSNLIHLKDWKSAIILAVDLNHPRRLYEFLDRIFNERLKKPKNMEIDSFTGSKDVDDFFRELSLDQVRLLQEKSMP